MQNDSAKMRTATFMSVTSHSSKRVTRKREYAFQMRRDALSRVGLSQVRQHRLRLLEEDVRVWTEALRKREQIMPELLPVLILRVEAEHG